MIVRGPLQPTGYEPCADCLKTSIPASLHALQPSQGVPPLSQAVPGCQLALLDAFSLSGPLVRPSLIFSSVFRRAPPIFRPSLRRHVTHLPPWRHLLQRSPSSPIATTSNGGSTWRPGFAPLVPCALCRALRAGPASRRLWTVGNVENYATTTPGWTLRQGRSGTVWRGSSRRIWRRSETILRRCGGSWSLCTCRNVPVRVLTPTTPSYPSPSPRMSPSARCPRELRSSSRT